MPAWLTGTLGALYGLLAVVGGALAAHVLASRLQPQQLAWFDSALRMLAFHASALLLLALQQQLRPTSPVLLRWTGILLASGTVLFCGSLVALALGASRSIAHLAPFGGLALIGGWSCWIAAWLRLR